MTDDILLIEKNANGVARLTMNRPEMHNAFDDVFLARIGDAVAMVDGDDDVRVIVLAANGKSFSAGADLNWMRRMAGYSEAENIEDARRLARVMRVLASARKPTVALAQGAAYGGGVGLVACCDIAIASEAASFSLSEVRLGLIPAVISPYVVAAIGPRQSRRYFQTAERFDAAEARRIGLVHAVVPADGLESRGAEIVDHLLKGGANAQAAAKDLVTLAISGASLDEIGEETALRIARIRATDEGREGLGAFLEKRQPNWQ